MKDTKAKAAKRMIAESAARKALEEIEKVRESGGPRSLGGGPSYQIAMHLLRHAAEQLRLSEGD